MNIGIYHSVVICLVILFSFWSCNVVSRNVITVVVYIILFLLLIGFLWYSWRKRKRIKAENSSIVKFNNDILRILEKIDTKDEKIKALKYALDKVEKNEEYNKNRAWKLSLIITVYLHMTMIYAEQGDDKMVIRTCNNILELNPKHAISYYNRGYTYHKLGKRDKAISDLEKYLAIDGKDRSKMKSNALTILNELKQNK